MVGLTGIVATQKNDIDVEKLLSKMCNAIRYKDKHKTDVYVNNEVGIGRVHIGTFNPDSQPIFNEDRTMCIMMDGEIYDYQNIKDDLISRGHKFLIGNEPELILHLYEEYGDNFVHKLNGIFSLIIWNEDTHKLLIVNDRYGLRPIYYTNHKGYLLFGSEVKAILQDNTFKRVVDDRSVAEFFSFGYILGTKTLFLGIELLPPASIMTYDNTGHISIKQYWDFDFNKEYENYNEEYYIEKLSHIISQAIKRQMKKDDRGDDRGDNIENNRIGILLSGGLDSRTIIACIDKEYYPIHTFTYGKTGCNDIKFAQMISDKLGTIHHIFEFEPEDISVYAEELVYKTDGMLNIFNAPRMQTYGEISEFSNIILHGWIGDSTMGDYLNGHLNQDNLKNFERLCYYLPTDFLRNLFGNNYFPIAEKNLNSSKNYIMKLGEHIKLPENRLMYCNLKERQRRIISVGFIYMRNYIESRTPFSDYDYIDFSLNIPPNLKYNKKLYKKMIMTTFPQLGDIPHSATGLSLYRFRSLYRPSELLQLCKLVINKITKKVIERELFYNKGNLADYGNWIRNNKSLQEYISNILLDQRTLKRPYFDQRFVKEILNSHMKGEKDYSILIGLLLTFELWNRQFIDKNKDEIINKDK